MPLTSQLNIPNKQKPTEPWSFNRLFPVGAMISALSKTSVNLLDVLFGYLVFVMGIGELFNRPTSWHFQLYSFLVLAASMYIKYFLPFKTPAKKK